MTPEPLDPDASPPAAPPARASRRARRGLSGLFVLAVLGFWWLAVRDLPLDDALRALRGNGGWLVLAFVCAGLYLLGQAFVWRRIVGDLVVWLPWPVALRTWLVSNMGRYLPGSMWHLVGRVTLGRAGGVAGGGGALAVVLEQGLQLLAALAIVVASLPFWPGSSIVRQWAWVALLVPVGLVALHPRVFYPTLNTVLAWVGRARVPPAVGYRRLLGYAALHGLAHLANGLALGFAAVALGAPWTSLPAMVGAALFAWTAGYLTVIAPGGLGVREVAVTAAAAPLVGAEVAAVAAALWRLANVATELVAAGLAELGWRRASAARTPPP
jgi:uncharacterized membrane protein YbhN (UPF0104 family)